jgi:hypothetical protein
MMFVVIVTSIAVAAAICFAGMSSEDGNSVDCGFRRDSQADVAGNAKIWLEPPAFKQLG